MISKLHLLITIFLIPFSQYRAKLSRAVLEWPGYASPSCWSCAGKHNVKIKYPSQHSTVQAGPIVGTRFKSTVSKANLPSPPLPGSPQITLVYDTLTSSSTNLNLEYAPGPWASRVASLLILTPLMCIPVYILLCLWRVSVYTSPTVTPSSPARHLLGVYS